MRPDPFSTAERNFILQALLEDQRFGGRKCEDFRPLKLQLGKDRGSCIGVLGQTKVLAQVSCELCAPKAGRPQDGSIFVNLEMSPMASPNFEVGRLGEYGIEICRLLERIIKECNCIDTESLCVQAGEKIWHIRVDVHVLDNDGSIIDCASAAALTALIHFRRPDVSVIGESVRIHSEDEREPVPLNLYHHPVAVTFGFTEEGRVSLVDPTEKEEHILEGTVVFVMNSRRELCALHCSGGLTVSKTSILKCASKALVRAIEVTDSIKSVIANDAETRSQGPVLEFIDQMISTQNLTGFEREYSQPFTCQMRPSTSEGGETVLHFKPPQIETHFQKNTAHLGHGGKMVLMNERDSDEDVEILEEISTAFEKTMQEVPSQKKKRKNKCTKQKAANTETDQLLGAIEDEIAVLQPEDIGYEKRPESPEIIVDKIDFTAAIKAGKKKKKHK